MTQKRIARPAALILSLLFVLTLALTGCGGNSASGGSGGESTGGSGDTDGNSVDEGKDEILIGYVASFTGPLSNFTTSLEWVEEKCLAVINAEGGIYIEQYDKELPVRIIYGDSESDPTKAMEVADKLVMSDKVDILVGSGTPDNMMPVASVAERRGVPAFLSDGPVESWRDSGPYEWSAGIFFDFEMVVTNYIAQWDKLDTNKKVGYVLDNEVDGINLTNLLNAQLPGAGYEIVDPGRFPKATNDYTNVITQLKNADCEIVVANMVTPDFAVLWKQMQQSGYIPKVLTVGKALHFYSDVAAIDNSNALMTEYHWDRTFPYTSSLLGLTCDEIAAAWEEDFPDIYPPSPIGYDTATLEILSDALSRCKTLEPEEIMAAIRATDYEGVYGHISFDETGKAIMPCVAAQWVPDDEDRWNCKIIVNGSVDHPEIPTVDPIYMPNYTN